MSRSLWVLAVCAVLTACVTSQPGPQQAEAEVRQTGGAEREIEQASDAFLAARQNGDASSFAALFTENGVFMVPGVTDAAGRSAVRELAQKRFAGGRTADFEIQKREIHVSGGSAYELAWFSETDRRPDQAFRLQGRHFILWNREGDGVWRVQRYLYNFSGATPLP